MQLNVASMPLRNFFKKIGKSNLKALPHWVSLLPLEKQRSILIGYLLGDGCFSDGRLGFVSISPTLAFQIYEMLLRNGVPCSIKSYPGKTGVKFKGRDKIYNTKRIYSVNLSATSTEMVWSWIPGSLKSSKLSKELIIKYDQSGIRFSWDLLLGKICSIDKVEYNGPTYCLDVAEDHSFHANGIVVHNCFSIALGLELIEHGTIYLPERSIFGPPPLSENRQPTGSPYS
jgi:intein/homing endonuclease